MQALVDAPLRLQPGHRHPLPSARRAEPAVLAQELEMVGRSGVVAALLQAVDATLLVLNAQRQIVASNGPPSRRRDLEGLRPGEALACANARSPAGCGTGPACQHCGALGAILGCQGSGRVTEAECLLSGAQPGEAHEFAVRALPVEVDGAAFTVVSLRDVSIEKRCERLEQVFVHDLLNTVTGLRGWAWRLQRPDADPAEAAQHIDHLSRRLEREIRDHRALILAERGELQPVPERVQPAELLRDLLRHHFSHDAASERRLELTVGGGAIEVETDAALLTRVLVNMVKNALEATAPTSPVRLGCELLQADTSGTAPAQVRFAVQNDGEIPADVKPRIFQRSFSTKAARGRGLGTYGMKLLGERYLGGRVTFSSTQEAGTVFEIRLPVVV
jgi:signal transduction histidine kinase